jgi:putative transposase
MVDYIKKAHISSHARACKIIGISRTRKYYKKIMPEKDAQIKAIIEQFMGTSRKGREKIIWMVRKQHPEIGSSKIRRVYEREGFSLYKRLKRRIKDNPANPILIPDAPNVERAMDFMVDALVDGRKIRTLNVVDHYNRKCLTISVASTFPARRVIQVMDRLVEEYGKPKKIRTDNGTEFRSKLFQKWLQDNRIEWSKIQKGKPQQNAIVERFNKTYREDVLDAYLFSSLENAMSVTEEWIKDYNNERPHQALKYETPNSYAA